MKRIISMAIIGIAVAAFCAAEEGQTFQQEGIASWYGTEFDGRPTASGEIFNSRKFTAAHPTLPFGTLLKVTNKHNNKSVEVMVNDRGPFVAARIIDVSQAAAEQLDMIATGTAPVLIEPARVTLRQTTVQTDKDIVEQIAEAQAEQAEAAETVQTDPAQAAETDQNAQTAWEDSPHRRPGRGAGSVEIDSTVDTVAEPDTGRRSPNMAEIEKTSTEKDLSSSVVEEKSPKPQVRQETTGKIRLRGQYRAGSNKTYSLQVGAYKQSKNAEEAFQKLKGVGFTPEYRRHEDLTRVVVTGVPADGVECLAETMGKAGFMEVLVREE